MANIPTPGLLRAIHGLDDSDLKLKIRTAGVVVQRHESGSRIVLRSDSSYLIVDCTIPMTADSLSNYLPRLSDRLIVLGYLRSANIQEIGTHKSFPCKYTLEALILKQTPGLDLVAWEESIRLE
ncbi:hypothetical protein Pst134EA_024065 [Puccinia striiformis f. sp. tritici]|uniref:Uncharacterized protein n=1 Tax=Puccinia striiformis TaxID=27350 RepID=A0A2S4UI23_9BASI|nr:hypothetical protein Pst134EA_024065 [Puccinia striiformis f. sp. tritici]KAH9453178.1 hypothetical protein Pst134EA_024065 [Puccinia striiformis f. sp. tritici]POV96945.1 hypothetical protein PSHT_14853 [Puccinia striiformis]